MDVSQDEGEKPQHRELAGVPLAYPLFHGEQRCAPSAAVASFRTSAVTMKLTHYPIRQRIGPGRRWLDLPAVPPFDRYGDLRDANARSWRRAARLGMRL